MGDAEVLGPVDQPGNIAIGRATARALLGDSNQAARRIRVAFEIADAEERRAEAGVDEETAGQRRRPRRLSDGQRPSEHANGLR